MSCPPATWANLQAGIFDLCSCSKSKQNCATLPGPQSGGPAFNGSSCVSYPQWPADDPDLGVCGWAGAPCTIVNNSTNCYYGSTDYCVGGVCIGGLNEPCLGGGRCLGTINCGNDGLCGGNGAWVQFGGGLNGTVNTTEVRLSCISASYYIDPSPSKAVLCTDPKATPGNHKGTLIGAIVGGVVGGLVIIAAGLWYLRKKHYDKFHPNTPLPNKRNKPVHEPSWFVDNELPWNDPDVNRNSSMIQPRGSQGGDSGPIVERNYPPGTTVSTLQVYDSPALTTPLAASSRRTVTDQSEIDVQRLVDQPPSSTIQDTQYIAPAGPPLSSHPIGTSTSIRLPEADEMHITRTLLEAQQARMHAEVQKALNRSSPPPRPPESGTSVPPVYSWR